METIIVVNTFAEFIKDYMEQEKLSQRDMARQVGVSNTAVSNWAKGKSTPNLRQLIDIAKATGESLEILAMLIDPDLRSERSVTGAALLFARWYDKLPDEYRKRVDSFMLDIKKEAGLLSSKTNEKP